MDQSKAITHLLLLFPHKSLIYLQEKLQESSNNLRATVAAIHDDKTEDKNFFQKLFCCFNSLEEEATNDSELIEIRIGEEFGDNLAAKFGASHLLPEIGIQPVIELPVTLAQQLYAAYVESVYKQEENYKRILSDLEKEDEEFARRLQDEENLQQFTAQDKEVHYSNQKKEDINREVAIAAIPQGDFVDSYPLEKGNYYREQAAQHLEKRKEFFRLAKHYLEDNENGIARHYFSLAQQEKRLIEEANKCAVAAFLEKSNNRKDCIDLHHLYVREAIEVLDNFLDEEIFFLKEDGLRNKRITVITGRGKHSQGGIPRVKPAVIKRLQERRLSYVEVNQGGCLRVEISRDSLLRTEI